MEKIVENFNVYEYFKNIAAEKNLLFSVELDITARCNANCAFCFQGNIHEELGNLTLDDYESLLKELKHMGVYNLGFSGGEPFYREDFLNILEIAKSLGFRISFITNGQLINFEKIDRLSEIGVDRVTVSFHSINRNIYNYHFGINNNLYFNKSLSNIKYMITKGIPLGIAITVTKFNIDELKEIKDFFVNMGIDSNFVNFNMLLTGAKNIEMLRPSREQLERNKEILQSNRKSFSSGFLCSVGRTSCSIDCKGNVYPCTFFNVSAGNIHEKPISDIWNNSHIFKIIRSIKEKNFSKCNQCKHKNKCNVCMVTNINETENIFTPSLEYCHSKGFGEVKNEKEY